MALRLLGTKGATQLACLNPWTNILLWPDLGAIGAAISSDKNFATYVQATATTAGSTSLTAVAARAGSPPISQIQVGDQVVGSAADIVPGTCVTAVSGGGATVTLSQNAASSGTGKGVLFLRQTGSTELTTFGDTVTIPGRGTLKIMPGDIVAVDSSGWPILISAASIAYPGSDWTLT